MKQLNEIGVLYNPGIRGLLYLDAFIRNGVIPNVIIAQGKLNDDFFKKYPDRFCEKYRRYFDIKRSLDYYLSKYSIDVIQLQMSDINSEEMIKVLMDRPEKYFIFSGGGIIGEHMFDTGKRFIHIHPGILPEFKGSTCYYYSILKDGYCGATAFHMQRELDCGPVIAQKLFKVPRIEENDWMFFDLLFDPWIRAELLYEVVKSYKDNRNFNSIDQDMTKGKMYYIIHPVLKNIAIKRYIENKI